MLNAKSSHMKNSPSLPHATLETNPNMDDKLYMQHTFPSGVV